MSLKRFLITLIIIISVVCCKKMYIEADTREEVIASEGCRLYIDEGKEVFMEIPAGTEMVKLLSAEEFDVIEYCGLRFFADHDSYKDTRQNYIEYYGNKSITAYCHCRKCTGDDDLGTTAMGTVPTANHTIACNKLPLGTKVLIKGKEYVVEDTGSGVGSGFDIYFSSHQEAVQFGRRNLDVYIIKG